MLPTASLMVNIKAPDLDEAASFYETLGFEQLDRRSLMPGHEDILFRVGDTTICLERGEGGKVPFEPITLEVEDAEAAVASLRERGLQPEEYDLPSIKTVDGIASFGSGGEIKAAWFKDPAGNLVGVMTRVRTQA